MIKTEFWKLKQVINMTHYFYVEAWSSMVEVYWTLDGTIFILCPFFEWYLDNFPQGKFTPARVRVRVSFRVGGGG